MRKRLFAFIFSFALVSSLCFSISFASENRASKTLSFYSVSCRAGSKSGELRFSYDVRANTTADSVGVSSIVLYNSAGVYMTTVLGSTSNGLIDSNCVICKDTYSHTAVSGNSYYAVVTVFAQIGDEYDSSNVITYLVTAP